MCGRKLHGCWRTRRSHRAASPAPVTRRVRNPFKLPQPRWQGRTLPSVLKNLLWKQGEHRLERAQTHRAVYPRLLKRSKLGTRGNMVTLEYWRCYSREGTRNGDREHGTGTEHTERGSRHGGTPTSRGATPTAGDAAPASQDAHPPGGSQPGHSPLHSWPPTQPQMSFRSVSHHKAAKARLAAHNGGEKPR